MAIKEAIKTPIELRRQKARSEKDDRTITIILTKLLRDGKFPKGQLSHGNLLRGLLKPFRERVFEILRQLGHLDIAFDQTRIEFFTDRCLVQLIL